MFSSRQAQPLRYNGFKRMRQNCIETKHENPPKSPLPPFCKPVPDRFRKGDVEYIIEMSINY